MGRVLSPPCPPTVRATFGDEQGGQPRERHRFALEHERTPKAAGQYLSVRQRIEQEKSITHFLYMMANYDLLRFVADKLSECKRAVHFGLLRDFLQLTLALPVRRNGTPVSMTLASVLTGGDAVQKAGTLWGSIAV